MKLAVILVNYNGEKYNTACIDSVLASVGMEELEVVVVDNASRDGSMRLLEERYAEDRRLVLLRLDDNYGFSRANNVGIDQAREWGADHVLLLNNDTEIAPDMLSRLWACAQRHPGSVIVPKIYYSDDRKRLWSAGGEFSRVIKKARHTGLNETDKGQHDQERQIGFATGCCLWIPMEAVRKAGTLDERFFLYYEDTEYSFRLREFGIPVYYCPQAVMYHKVGASTKGADSPLCAYYIARNWLLCSRLHLGWRYPLFLLYYAANRTACCLLWQLGGKGTLVRATGRGIRDYCGRKYGRTPYYG